MANALIFIPGWASSPAVFDPIASQLPQDQPIGYLDWADALEAPAAALRACIAETNRAASLPEETPAVVAGWSLGGQLLLQAALEQPDLLAGALFISTPARLLADGATPGADAAKLRAMRLGLRSNREGVIEQFWIEAFAPLRREASAWEEACSSANADILNAGLFFLQKTDLRDALRPLPCPSLIVHGEEDAIVPAASADALARRLQADACLVLPRAGHALPLSHPAPIARLCSSLLSPGAASA